jgi:hypothetical protein
VEGHVVEVGFDVEHVVWVFRSDGASDDAMEELGDGFTKPEPSTVNPEEPRFLGCARQVHETGCGVN